MYDELVKSLRELCEMMALCDNYNCFECPYEEKCGSYKTGRLSAVYRQAADAIEFLQTYKVALENIILIGGWWLVGQDKNLHRMNVPMNWPPKGTKAVEVFTLPKASKEG